MPSATTAPITIPAIAPWDKVVGGDGELVESLPPMDDEVAVGEPVVGATVVKRERSVCWKATVMGCAHMRTGPETPVNTVDVPSRLELKPPSSANTVVAPVLPK